ncbi:MAG: hypothetical protein COA78_35005 [Blastopirellula sp.]|nr:MAG: hypothetical protein COA78_35005 [Blastopirellula sp.]
MNELIDTRATEAIDEEAVRDFLTGRCAKFKQPKEVFPVPELPRNAMGKVQKKQLRETCANLVNIHS